ncbi:MAG: hypothetical protein IPP76_09555 [Moraxellaceae bacterium]|nr:hypothetical protein [Moraxellaceae bacterium]
MRKINFKGKMSALDAYQQGTNRLLVSDDRQGIDPNVEQTPLSSHQLACLLGRFLCAYAATQWPLAA